MTETNAQGHILVSQSVHQPIVDAAIVEALPEAQRRRPYHIAAIDAVSIPMAAAGTIDWPEVRRETERAYLDRLRPLTEQYPGYRVAYFGTAPVPLAMYLGHLVGSWVPSDVYQLHHRDKVWAWRDPAPGAPAAALRPMTLPQDVVRTEGDVVIRVSTSNRIDPADTVAVVPEPLAEIDIALEVTDFDALATPADVERVAEEFVRALDAVAEKRPGTQVIHVFAAVPVGLAFRLGTCVSVTKYPRVQTYQYLRTASPHYHPAILLQEEPGNARVATPAEQERAAALREVWATEHRLLRDFALQMQDHAATSPGVSWLRRLLPHEQAAEAEFGGRWRTLPALYETPLAQSEVDQSARSSPGGFEFDTRNRRWVIDDGLLGRIAARLTGDDAKRAGRMFLLHEGVHLRPHRLTTPTSQRIGRFPKVVEEVDYQADVWTMLHDYAFTRARDRSATDNPRLFFLRLIDTALQTFWAFDDEGGALREIQVRRLNRYLIWYWQQLRIEHADGLGDILKILAERPVLELAGPATVAREERVFYALDARRVANPELAVLANNAIARFGQSPGVRLHELIEGFRARDGERVKDVLRGVFDQLPR